MVKATNQHEYTYHCMCIRVGLWLCMYVAGDAGMSCVTCNNEPKAP